MVKRQRLADVQVPVVPGVAAGELFVLVFDADFLESGVEGAVVFDELVLDAAVDSEGNIYVVQSSYDFEDANSFPPTRHRVQKFNPDGGLPEYGGIAALSMFMLSFAVLMTLWYSRVQRQAPRYAIVKASVARPEGDLEPAYARLEAELGADTTDRQDGLWLGWTESGRWLHFRPSGTEPIVRMIAEAPTENGARALVDAARRALGAG